MATVLKWCTYVQNIFEECVGKSGQKYSKLVEKKSEQPTLANYRLLLETTPTLQAKVGLGGRRKGVCNVVDLWRDLVHQESAQMSTIGGNAEEENEMICTFYRANVPILARLEQELENPNSFTSLKLTLMKPLKGEVRPVFKYDKSELLEGLVTRKFESIKSDFKISTPGSATLKPLVVDSQIHVALNGGCSIVKTNPGALWVDLIPHVYKYVESGILEDVCFNGHCTLSQLALACMNSSNGDSDYEREAGGVVYACGGDKFWEQEDLMAGAKLGILNPKIHSGNICPCREDAEEAYEKYMILKEMARKRPRAEEEEKAEESSSKRRATDVYCCIAD